MKNRTHFKTLIRTLTGCNEANADYIADSTLCDLNRLRNMSFARLTSAQQDKAKSLVDALILAYRGNNEAMPKVTCSSDVYNIVKPHLEGLLHEEVWVLLMNQAAKVIQVKCISSGGLTGTVVDPKVLMKAALQASATRIILVHNHPSGNTRPSDQDIRMTQKVQQGAALLDIELTDHVIYAGDRFYSFLDEGML